MDKVAVIGIGNILQRDDGFGVHVVNELQKENLPSTIELVDGGTSTLSMIGYFMDFKKVIVIDAIRTGLEPGTIYKIEPEDLVNYKKEQVSVHDVQILDIVKMVNMAAKYPDVVIYGIEPAEISFNLEMTEIMYSKVPDMINHIQKELGLA